LTWLHPYLAELYRRKVSELEAALTDPEIRDEALAILRCLIDKAVLRPFVGGFEIELAGEIVAMEALGQKTPKSKAKTAAPDARMDCSI
jgi:hypothetical protein